MVVAFLQSCDISGVVFIVLVRGVAIRDGITKTVKKTKSRILVVSVGERVHATDNARRGGERVEGTSFDVASCTEVE